MESLRNGRPDGHRTFSNSSRVREEPSGEQDVFALLWTGGSTQAKVLSTPFGEIPPSFRADKHTHTPLTHLYSESRRPRQRTDCMFFSEDTTCTNED